jgi:anaerobic magnesium-protoporphyrin IX monomethyl ester cyclase
MRILLVQPPSAKSFRTHVPAYIEKSSGILPPLGLLSLAAMFDNSPHAAEILDCDLEALSREAIKARISASKPDIVGVTVNSFTLLGALDVARAVKEAGKSIPVVFGGPHCDIYPLETASQPDVDFVITGEGEISLPKLIEALGSDKNFSAINGLAYKNNGAVTFNDKCEVINDLDNAPFARREGAPDKRYYSLLSQDKLITTMFTSRGCPFNCLYCYHNSGRSFRAMSAKRVVDEMQDCEKKGFQEIFIIDDTFTVDKKRVLEIGKEISRRKLKIAWDARAHVNTLDNNLVDSMKAAGCTRLHIGIEAGTPEISKVLRKNLDLDAAKKLFRYISSKGIQTLAYFMIGSPRESREQILRTIDFAIELDPDYAQFSIATPFPNTDLYLMGLKEGVFKKDYWKEFAQNPTEDFTPLYWTKEVPEEELLELLDHAYKKFYRRPGYLLKTLLRIRSFSELKRKALSGAGIFLHGKSKGKRNESTVS